MATPMAVKSQLLMKLQKLSLDTTGNTAKNGTNVYEDTSHVDHFLLALVNSSHPAIAKEAGTSPQNEEDAQKSVQKLGKTQMGEDLPAISSIYDQSLMDSTTLLEHELSQLPSELDLNSIDVRRRQLSSHLEVITNELQTQIVHRQAECLDQLKNVQKVQNDLAKALDFCKMCRNDLKIVQDVYTTNSLRLLSSIKRRRLIEALSNELGVLHSMHKLSMRIRQLVSIDDFVNAVNMAKTATKERHALDRDLGKYCVGAKLTEKLNDVFIELREKIDNALAKMCWSFDAIQYERVYSGYALLESSGSICGQICLHVTTSIHKSSSSVVAGHVALLKGIKESNEEKSFEELCLQLSKDSLVASLIDLCRALTKIMASFDAIVDFHSNKIDPKEENVDDVNKEDALIVSRLEQHRVRVWLDVQSKIKCFVMAQQTHLEQLDIDHFLLLMDVFHKLLEVGHRFFQDSKFRSATEDNSLIETCLHSLCSSYFTQFHRSRLDELRMHLENDGYEPCPIRRSSNAKTFNVAHLSEFRHLSNETDKSGMNNESDSTVLSSFSSKLLTTCPFDSLVLALNALSSSLSPDESFEKSVFYSSSSEEEDLDEENDNPLLKNYVDEMTGEDHKNASRVLNNDANKISSPNYASSVVLTNTSLMVMRLWGKYIRLGRSLPVLSNNIVVAIAQLIQLYALGVVHAFAPDHDEKSQVLSQDELQTLRSMKHNLLAVLVPTVDNVNDISTPNSSPRKESKQQHQLFQCNSSLVLQCEEGNDWRQRLIAVESLASLLNQFNSIKTIIEGHLSKEGQIELQSFFNESFKVLLSLGRPVLFSVACSLLPSAELVLQLMAKVEFDLKEVCTQHSHYVDILIKDFQGFNTRVDELERTCGWPITHESRQMLKEMCVLKAALIFIEGFSVGKRCSNEGRALMQLDFRQFVIKVEKLLDLKPLPHQERVTAYVKAFYIPEADLEAWISQHKEMYTSSQLVSLVNSVSYSNNSRAKQKLNALIGELSGKINKIHSSS